MRSVIVSFALIVLSAGLQGCGLKGPLYLPEPAKPVEPTASPEQATADQEAERKKKTSQPAPSTVP